MVDFYPHQSREIALHSEPARALWWEMGCGKTLAVLETFAAMVNDGLVSSLLVVAPPQVIAHGWSGAVRARGWRSHKWETRRAKTKAHRKGAEGLLCADCPTVLLITYDAINTRAGSQFAEDFLKSRRALMVLDESHLIKNPKAARTKTIHALGKIAPFRRILTGTPASDSPFGAWSQIQFLDPGYWRANKINGYHSFTNRFGVFRDKYVGAGRPPIRDLVNYQRLDELQRHMLRFGEIVALDDVVELPGLVRFERAFDLDAQTRRAYDNMRKYYFVLLKSKHGALMTATEATTALIRLQQISCGFVTDDETGEIRPTSDVNPRLTTLHETLQEIDNEPALIWCRWTHDVKEICKHTPEAVPHYGEMGRDERAAAVDKFINGKARYLVATQQTAAAGLDGLQGSCRNMIYYSCGYSLTYRLQSEGRLYRIGQSKRVRVIDIVAANTADERIVAALTNKRDQDIMSVKDVVSAALEG